jgi:hypothetical protein
MTFEQGFSCDGRDPRLLTAALDAAFDYRGNVTLLLADGSELVGYVFNRELSGPAPFVQLLPADGGARRRIPLGSIRGVAFTGRDTAAGKSWETWLEKQSGKARGEAPQAAGPPPSPADTAGGS